MARARNNTRSKTNRNRRSNTKSKNKDKQENRRTVVYIILLLVALLLWIALNSVTNLSEPGGNVGGAETVFLWKYEKSFDNKDMSYIESVLPEICKEKGDEECSSLCDFGTAESDCSLDRVYTNSYTDTITGENVIRIHVNIKGNTVCKCSL